MRRLAFILPTFLMCSLFMCKKPVEHASVPLWYEDDHPLISKASLFDTLHVDALRFMDIKEIMCVTAVYSTGKKICYFEYDANPEQLLTLLSCLPFEKNNAVSDTTARLQDFAFSLSAKDILPQEEVDAAHFFWDVTPQDFDYYECVKSPARHTVLIHKKTRRILHRIETEA